MLQEFSQFPVAPVGKTDKFKDQDSQYQDNYDVGKYQLIPFDKPGEKGNGHHNGQDYHEPEDQEQCVSFIDHAYLIFCIMQSWQCQGQLQHVSYFPGWC